MRRLPGLKHYCIILFFPLRSRNELFHQRVCTDSSPTTNWGKTLEPLWTAPVVYSVSVSSAREDGSHCSLIVFGVRSPRSSCAVRRRCVCGGVCACVLLLCTLLRVFLLVLLQVLQILQHLLDQRGHAARDLHLQGHHPLSSCGHGKLKIMLRVFHFFPAQTGLIQVSFTYQTIL